MKSLYGQYIAEREAMGIVESACGFATYKIDAGSIYLRDLYVIPEARRDGAARELADRVRDIGKKSGCSEMTGSVCVDDPRATDNIRLLIRYGMRFHSVRGSLMLFVKEL